MGLGVTWSLPMAGVGTEMAFKVFSNLNDSGITMIVSLVLL